MTPDEAERLRGALTDVLRGIEALEALVGDEAGPLQLGVATLKTVATEALSTIPSEPGAARAPSTPRCSFCSKEQGEVEKLIAGPSVHICSECIALCAEFVNEPADAESRATPTPDDDEAGPVSSVRRSEFPPRNDA